VREDEPPRRVRVVAALALALWLVGAAAATRVGFWLALGTTAVILGLAALATEPSLLGFRGRARPGFVLLGLASGAVMAAVAGRLYPWLGSAAPWIAADTSVLYLSFAAVTPTQAALVLPAIVLGEELFWRGLLHHAFLARLPAGAAVLLGAAAYAAGNAPTGSPVLMLTAFACGLVWSGLRVATGGLLAPLLSHLTWNALVLLIHPLSR
jgi:membrane protease YdiL (CAAX protease family)